MSQYYDSVLQVKVLQICTPYYKVLQSTSSVLLYYSILLCTILSYSVQQSVRKYKMPDRQ